MPKQFHPVAEITTTSGFHGEVRLRPFSRFSIDYILQKTLQIGTSSDNLANLKLEKTIGDGKRMRFKFEGIDSHNKAKNMIDRDFPNFSQLPESTQKKINDQVISYYKDKKYTAETFENYQLRGTPSTILIDKSGILRGKWFGSGFGLETEIENLLNEE